MSVSSKESDPGDNDNDRDNEDSCEHSTEETDQWEMMHYVSQSKKFSMRLEQ